MKQVKFSVPVLHIKYVISSYLEPPDLWDWLASNDHRKGGRLPKPYAQILHVHLHHWRICKNLGMW